MENSKKKSIKFIKYEDLLRQTYSVFLDTLKYINQIYKNKEKKDKDKIKKILKSTSFETLKKNEIEKGFSEAVPSKKDKNKKISFFHLGPKNDWNKILDENLKLKLVEVFENDLKTLSYD